MYNFIRVFGLFSLFFSNRLLRVLLGRVLRVVAKVPYYTDVPQGNIPRLTLFLLYICDVCDDIIHNLVIYVDDTRACNLWQQLSWLLNLTLTYETVWTGAENELFMSMLKVIIPIALMLMM